MRILLIDDEEDVRNLLSRFIRSQWPDAEIEPYDHLERELPDAAFPLRSYDVIILDYMLGRGDGLEWLKSLKQREDCPKVLFLTGAGNEIIAVRAMKAGADDYQRKQELTREKLIKALESLSRYEPGVVPPIEWSADYHGGPRSFGYATWKNGKLQVLQGW